ncbi:hypothetical protein NKJ86_13985 [Mesorhizobium sp. M0025]|uniref:hypothetical protein n=1 Tax=Mesorhizobium sp. M0025 TaxID=2956846 RepID=UPI003336660D
MNYSSLATACHSDEWTGNTGDANFDNLSDHDLEALEVLELELAAGLEKQARVDNKVKPTHVKSAYRDALFRPLFQAVAISEGVRANGGTSVTSVAPSHPLYPVIRYEVHPSYPLAAFYKPEGLTHAEEIRHARFWRSYEHILPRLRQHTRPADWRDLSDPGRLEWFHHAVRHSGSNHAFSVNLSAHVEAQAKTQGSTAGWLSKRIARRLKAALGREVDCWFVLEVSQHHRLHLHGELQIAGHEAEGARKALRLAAGEWKKARQHQAHTQDQPSVVWTNYSCKEWAFIRRFKTGRFVGISRPINGEWYSATKPIRRLASELYFIQHLEVMKLMTTLSLPSPGGRNKRRSA